MEDTKSKEETQPPVYLYTDKDFIYHTPGWKDPNPVQLSKFDLALHQRWNEAMSAGAFRYGIDHVITRVVPGNKEYVTQLNPLRASERRRPQNITSVSQPFNPDAFNFTRIKNKEIVFDLLNVTGSADAAKTGLQNDGNTRKQHQCHRLIVNVSPMEYGHSLLVPQVFSHNPQILTQTAFEVAIEAMLLSNHRGFRMSFNSLCGFASVNHLHFHVYYLEHELIGDRCPARHLAGPYYESSVLPLPAIILQLQGKTVKELARLAHRVSNFFMESDYAHNGNICRGTVLREDGDTMENTIRICLFPRKKIDVLQLPSDIFNASGVELGGHIPIYKEEGFYDHTEADMDRLLSEMHLTEQEYEHVLGSVTKMGLEEETNGYSED